MMHVYVVFAHPSRESFTYAVFEAFAAGLREAGHTFDVCDLYEIGFKSDMDVAQYAREMGSDPDSPVPEDVRSQQAHVNKADALVFIYPGWWSDCPAKLKGWFDRVWTYGYAYWLEDGERKSRIDVEKALVLCAAGHTVEHLEETGIAESMRRIMLDDRLLNVGVKEARMEILGGMTTNDEAGRRRNLQRAYMLGRDF